MTSTTKNPFLIAVLLAVHAGALALPVNMARSLMDASANPQRLQCTKPPCNERYPAFNTRYDLQNTLIEKVVRDFGNYKEVAKESGDKKLEEEAEEAEEEVSVGSNMLVAGLKSAVSESTLKAFQSGDPGQSASAVMGIAASMTAEIPEVGPFISIALTLFGSLFDMYGSKDKPTVPLPPTLDQISTAMRNELERFKTDDLQTYALPTVMFGLQSRINLYQDAFLSDSVNVTADQLEKDFLGAFHGDVVSDICGPSTVSPRGTLHQMNLDLVKRIRELPDKWAAAKAALPNGGPSCDNTKGWDNHADIAAKVATFQADYTRPILDGVAAYRVAAMQYLTLFGVVQTVFVQHAGVNVSASHELAPSTAPPMS